MHKCQILEESGGTGFVNSVAPSFPGSARVGKEIFANTPRHIIIDSKITGD
jgi:hypothetical protein